MKFHTEYGGNCVDMTREEFDGLPDRTGFCGEPSTAARVWKKKYDRLWSVGFWECDKARYSTLLVEGRLVSENEDLAESESESQTDESPSDAPHSTSQALRAVEALVDEKAAGETLAEVRRTLELIRAVVGVGR